MPGDGTKLTLTPNSPTSAYLLDVTRLCRRAGRHLTGVDRVERAYLKKFLSLDTPLYGLHRTKFGYLLLSRSGLAFLDALLSDGWQDLNHQNKTAQRSLEHLLRKHCDARVPPWGLLPLLKRRLPANTHYYNVGHANLTPRVMRAIRALPKSKINILIHDTIPLDHPDLQTPAAYDKLHRQIGLASAFADRIIFNSNATAADAARHFLAAGRMPPAIAAPLGIEPPSFAIAPTDFVQEPYFLALGTLEPRKRQDFLLDLWEEIHAARGDHTPVLVLAGGRGWYDQAFYDRLDHHPLCGDRIIEINGASDQDIHAYLAHARALLFPSLVEGYGLPVAESLAVGTPVICTDLPVYREFAADFPLYLPMDDRHSWIRAIDLCLAKDSRDYAAWKASLTVYAAPTWEEHFAAVLSE